MPDGPDSAKAPSSVPRRRRAESRDERLLRAVYAQHGVAVAAYAARLTDSTLLADDVTQETFLRAWRHADILTADDHRVRGWLLTVARNIVIDIRRAAKVRPREVSDIGVVATSPDHADRVDTALLVHDALAALPPHQREVLHQLFLVDRSPTDTAAAMGIPVGTVKSRTHYALRALRQPLGRGGCR